MKYLKPEFSKHDVESMVGLPIIDFSVTPRANREGTFVVGDFVYLEVNTASGQIRNFIVKEFPFPGNSEQQKVGSGILCTETCMHEEIFPRIENLLNIKMVNPEEKIQLQLSVPKCMSSIKNERSEFVCLEDLRPQGYKQQESFSSLTLAEVTLVMKEMAKFHALTYSLVIYEGDQLFDQNKSLNKIRFNSITVENRRFTEMFVDMTKTYLQNTVELLEPRSKMLGDKVRFFVETADTNRLKALQKFNNNRTDKRIFACIILGDIWTQNVLFKYGQEGNRDGPTELRFTNFRLSRRGNVYEDLNYFLWASTTPEFRRLHLMTVLNEYYLAFERTLKLMKFPMPIGFTRGSFIDGFEEGILPNYIYMTFALSVHFGRNIGEKMKTGAKQANKTDLELQETRPPRLNLNQMIESGKMKHKMRMIGSPKALDRLEDLTREIVEIGLLE